MNTVETEVFKIKRYKDENGNLIKTEILNEKPKETINEIDLDESDQKLLFD